MRSFFKQLNKRNCIHVTIKGNGLIKKFNKKKLVKGGLKIINTFKIKSYTGDL